MNDMTTPDCLAPIPPARRPALEVPPGACDCHAHVCGPVDRFPYIAERVYTPPAALPADYRRLLDALGIERGVIVQPSFYGTDNRALLAALAQDPARLRGVAVVPFDVAADELERLHAAGVRGVRCNIVDLRERKGELPLEPLRSLAPRIRPFGWHLELLMHVNEFPNLDTQLGSLGVPVSFGHLGYVPVAEGAATAGFDALLRLMRDGVAWVKLTGPYRFTRSAMPYPDVQPFADRLVEAAPQRLLWGSDWPHVGRKTGMPDDVDLLELLPRWVPDAQVRRRILVENPAQLYDF
ncbi:MAG TPA: amidohydrolase family protein [Burkholderiaceae bacterium]|nr:amidohydrolase family protein [Burkholderiaceae bacterium]